MSSTIDQLRAGLKARLATVSGLRAQATMTEDPVPPAAVVMPKRGAFDQTFDGKASYVFEVHLYMQLGDLNRAQTALDAYLSLSGANSLAVAVAADPTLGGVADYARVVGFEDYAAVVDQGGTMRLGARLQVEIYA